jgi:hypothetical protein
LLTYINKQHMINFLHIRQPLNTKSFKLMVDLYK